VAAFPAPTGPIVAAAGPAAPSPITAPATLSIPEIGVSTGLITLGLTAQVPPTTSSRAGTPEARGRVSNIVVHAGEVS
jgi:hypothetical protein